MNTDDNEIRLTGSNVRSRIVALMKEGNKYRVVLTNADGKDVVSIPATFAAIFTIIFPAWVVIAVALALVANFSLSIRRAA
jgi:hypothetical protein